MFSLENRGIISKPGDAGSWEMVGIVAIWVHEREKNPGALGGRALRGRAQES